MKSLQDSALNLTSEYRIAILLGVESSGIYTQQLGLGASPSGLSISTAANCCLPSSSDFCFSTLPAKRRLAFSVRI